MRPQHHLVLIVDSDHVKVGEQSQYSVSTPSDPPPGTR